MGEDLELGSRANSVDRPLQRRVLEGDETSAAHADHVVMVLAGIVALEGDDLAADIDAVDEVEVLKLLEGAVNGCYADAGEAPVDLQPGDGAMLTLE
ncbi:MAG: hypothetical protein QOF06_2224 [Solirubrobacterales bacterium]|nr:hypothetical protein [Solirubrobacterales bacterium]